MKKLKLITVFALTVILGFTSCQSEESIEVLEPFQNLGDDVIAFNYERVGMNDGSNDDFLDGNACIELLFPLTATVNNQQITLTSSLDFSTVLNIMGAFNDDSDSVNFNFPIRVMTRSYTEIVVNSKSELDALNEECVNAAKQGDVAISCIDIQFPITVLTYNVKSEQTGSVVLQSEHQLHTLMTRLQFDKLFAVDYPISATISNGTTIQIYNDEEFLNSIFECLRLEEATAEDVLRQGKFKVETFITGGVNTASDYVGWSIEFKNDHKVVALIPVITAGTAYALWFEGTYAVSSETAAFINIAFPSNINVSLSALGNDWVVDSYSTTLVSFKSKIDASVTLVLKKI